MQGTFLVFFASVMLWFLAAAMDGEFWQRLRLPLAATWLFLNVLFIVSMARLADALGRNGGGLALLAFFFPFIGGAIGYSTLGKAANRYVAELQNNNSTVAEDKVKGSENSSAAKQEYLATQRKAFAAVIEWVLTRGTLGQFPRVMSYLGKENGGDGWEDSYQEFLIEQLCESRWMVKTGPSTFKCNKDGSKWRLEQHEWRTSAYKSRLLTTEPDPSECSSIGATSNTDWSPFSDDFSRTVGMEPNNVKRVTLKDMVMHLTELSTGEYLEVSSES